MADGDLQRAFGRNIRQYRQGRGQSQEGFADEIGLHRTYVGELERGERNLTLGTVERICAALGVDPIQMMSDSN